MMAQGTETATPSLLLTLDVALLFHIMARGVREIQWWCDHFVSLQRNGCPVDKRQEAISSEGKENV
jgi:hypothetical protein